MQNKKIQSAYLDENVIFTMIITALLGLIVTGFQYKNYEHCIDFNIRAKANHFRTDEPIRFETDAIFAKDFSWDFGDNEQTETNINSAVHSFNQPGEYTVAVTVNGSCTEYKTIYIAKAQKLDNPLLIPQFICPQTAEVGQPVTFQDTTAGARSWEWRFGETASIDATSSTASYTYKTPGLKTISLILNGDPQQMGVCKVYVNEKNVPPPVSKLPPRTGGGGRKPSLVIVPAKPGTPTLEEQQNEAPPAVKEAPKPQGITIGKQELETKLRGVVNNLFTARDFSQYTCNNQNLPVSLNGQEITFAQFCNKLASIGNDKKIKQLNVQQIKNGETNCIIGLNVNLKTKQGFLGIF
jgi:FOG: PKD repeat